MALSLRAARVNRGLTQEEAAKRLGVSVGTLAGYEKGRRKPTIEMALKMSTLYEVKLDVLFAY